MRLDKFLSNSGKGSRKDIKLLLKGGTVSVNGNTVKDPAFKVDENTDTVTVENVPIIYKPYIYLMLNKPAGYVSAVFDSKLKTVTELVPMEYAHYEVFPVGRLDIDTEGLIVLTNDGDLCHRVLSPKSHIDKTYYLECQNELTECDVQAFKDGITLDDGYHTMSASLSIDTDPRKAYLTIQEGKFHQVKRMMEAVGNKVLYLKRVKMGDLLLDSSLQLGKIRELTDEEVILMSQKNKQINK